MSDQEKLNELSQKLERLLAQQKGFIETIGTLKSQIDRLQEEIGSREAPEGQIKATDDPKPTTFKSSRRSPEKLKSSTATVQGEKTGIFDGIQKLGSQSGKDFERFIGENLINKIGILITIIGVGIGAKYSIDNNLISPELRIILGYVIGLLLLGTGLKLKKNYLQYSAVLTSGALAIFYFITYFAYSFYGLIPETFAFGLMTLFTLFGVVAALNYNQQVIALIGLTGAYGVPFLIGGNPESSTPLLLYIALINIGILIIAIRKYWQYVHYAAFIFTWAIFIMWYHSVFEFDRDLGTGMAFSAVYFLLFYATFIVNKLIQKHSFTRMDVALILGNSFIFYGYGFSMLTDANQETNILGLFTIANALVHFVVSALIYRQKLADRSLFYFISGLVLVFLTITIPVQLTGNWVTLLWAGEALVLYWVGHSREISFYKKLSYPLIILSFISQSLHWIDYVSGHAFTYNEAIPVSPFLHIDFYSNLLYALLLGGIIYVAFINPGPHRDAKKGIRSMLLTYSIVGLFIFVLYTTLRLEIELLWQILFNQSQLEITQESDVNTIWNYNLNDLRDSWLINYTLLFFFILSALVWRWIHSATLKKLILLLNMLVLLIFLTNGLLIHSTLRSNYLLQPHGEYYHVGSVQLYLRYLSYILVSLLWFVSLKFVRNVFLKKEQKIFFLLTLHITILWIASSELIHWMDLMHSGGSDKLGLSILWGIYALLLIALGIWKNQKYLRIAAIVLFTTTLVKLFTYDLTSLSTVGKTIVFVSLGVLLLIISFLYNKYKNLITNEQETI